MTSKVYKSAQGKSIDLGTIMLQNEKVRAVGNMNVNARGDRLDSNNTVIESKPRQIQRRNARTTNVAATTVHTSANKAKKARKEQPEQTVNPVDEEVLIEETPVAVSAPPVQNEVAAGKVPTGGLAAAIARNREIKQELEKTRKQQQSSQGVKKL